MKPSSGPSLGAIGFALLPAPPGLESLIACVRVARRRDDGGAVEVKVCPNCFPGLVYHEGEGGGAAIEAIEMRGFRLAGLPAVFLHGQVTAPSVMRFRPGPYATIQVVLRPAALYRMFGEVPSTGAAGYLAPEDFSMPSLAGLARSAADDEARAGILCEAVAALAARASASDPLIEAGLEYIDSNVAAATVAGATLRAGISERQFEKRFRRAVGMGAQLYIRIRRMNEALRLMAEGGYERLSDVAYALDFYDQSHFIREIKAFTWLRPKDIAQRVSDFHRDLVGAAYL